MITVINGTNRPNNNTKIFSAMYLQMLEKKEVKSHLFSFEDLPQAIDLLELYSPSKNLFKQIVDKYIISSEKLVFIIPEYNGSYPGILKLFIDACNPEIFKNKKIAMVGVATGRAGNIRGMDDLTNVFHYLGAHILPYKLPISSILKIIDNNTCSDESTIAAMNKQVSLLIDF